MSASALREEHASRRRDSPYIPTSTSQAGHGAAQAREDLARLLRRLHAAAREVREEHVRVLAVQAVVLVDLRAGVPVEAELSPHGRAEQHLGGCGQRLERRRVGL